MKIGNLNIDKLYIGSLNVNKIYLGEELVYPSEPVHDYSKDYLTFKITSVGNIKWKSSNSALTRTIEYKLNEGNWTSITSSTGGTTIPVAKGYTVQFRGNNDTYSTNRTSITFSGTTAGFIAEGNIMSLINSTNFSGLTELTTAYTFVNLFQNCTGLTDASNLILPATTLANGCYSRMFQGCTSLTTAPELPATSFAYYCYSQMFEGCTSLVNAPIINRKNSEDGDSACVAMFKGCSSLTRIQFINLYNLDSSAQQMFWNCSNLNYVKCLTEATSTIECNIWLRGVSEAGTFIKHPDSTYVRNENGIPSGWTVVDDSGVTENIYGVTKEKYVGPKSGFTYTLELSKLREIIRDNEGYTFERTVPESAYTLTTTPLVVPEYTGETEEKQIFIGTVTGTVEYSGFTAAVSIDVYQRTQNISIQDIKEVMPINDNTTPLGNKLYVNSASSFNRLTFFDVSGQTESWSDENNRIECNTSNCYYEGADGTFEEITSTTEEIDGVSYLVYDLEPYGVENIYSNTDGMQTDFYSQLPDKAILVYC